MSFVIGLLTVVLVLTCIVLILLVLVQLPKKEAGAGLAFGGAASDALFGAGSGNMLTKITKYAAVSFFVLTMLVAVLQSKVYHSRTAELEKLLEQQGSLPPAVTQPAGTPPAEPAAAPAAAPATNLFLSTPAATTNSDAEPK